MASSVSRFKLLSPAYKIRACWGLLVRTSVTLRLQVRDYLLLILVVFLVVALLAQKRPAARIGGPRMSVKDNPQDFFMLSSTSFLYSSFRYDPRAADHWLFESGAALFANPMPSEAVNRATNRPTTR